MRAAGLLWEIMDSAKTEKSPAEKDEYFDSFESCYPLLAEAGEVLMAEAARLGIETEGKDKPEIAGEIFARRVSPSRAKRKEAEQTDNHWFSVTRL